MQKNQNYYRSKIENAALAKKIKKRDIYWMFLLKAPRRRIFRETNSEETLSQETVRSMTSCPIAKGMKFIMMRSHHCDFCHAHTGTMGEKKGGEKFVHIPEKGLGQARTWVQSTGCLRSKD